MPYAHAASTRSATPPPKMSPMRLAMISGPPDEPVVDREDSRRRSNRGARARATWRSTIRATPSLDEVRQDGLRARNDEPLPEAEIDPELRAQPDVLEIVVHDVLLARPGGSAMHGRALRDL